MYITLLGGSKITRYQFLANKLANHNWMSAELAELTQENISYELFVGLKLLLERKKPG